MPTAAAVVDRARPPERPDDLGSGEIEPVESALLDPVAERARQFPSAEFGKPLKLQPQPGSQLQNSRYVPEIAQLVISCR